MATESEDSSPAPSAQIVGNAFVEQYYLILHQQPDQVHRFYNDSSVLSRPGPDGVMTSVTTMEAINETIVSLNYKNYKAEILTADSEFSFKNGVIVLVTGCLTGVDNVRKKFTQSFFLAPQDKGYFVLNDVFRYLGESEPAVVDPVTPVDIDESAPTAPLTPDPEPTQPTHVPDNTVLNQTTPVVDDTTNHNKEASQPLANGKVSVSEKKTVSDLPIDSTQNNARPMDDTASNIQDDAPKKSFASVVHALKDNNAPFIVRVPPIKPAEQPRAPATPEAPAPSSEIPVERVDDRAVKAYAIFVPNLPMDATVEQLDEAFKKFGPIKHDGIQVRSNKQQGSCFGFVEFESASSMHSALQASPIPMFNRKLHIEERRANNNDRGRFPSGRGGFRSDSFRGRGNFSGGRGYGRNDFEKRGEFSGRSRSNVGRNGEAGQRAYQNGGGRAVHQAVKVE